MKFVRVIKRLLNTHRPVVTVNTYKVAKTDLKAKQNALHARLAQELGREWKAVR